MFGEAGRWLPRLWKKKQIKMWQKWERPENVTKKKKKKGNCHVFYKVGSVFHYESTPHTNPLTWHSIVLEHTLLCSSKTWLQVSANCLLTLNRFWRFTCQFTSHHAIIQFRKKEKLPLSLLLHRLDSVHFFSVQLWLLRSKFRRPAP